MDKEETVTEHFTLFQFLL